MALKPELETLDGLPEALREFYAQDESSGKYRLDVEGMVEKAKLDEFRNNNIALRKERDTLTSQMDELKTSYAATPEEVAEMKKTLDSIKDKKVFDDEGIEALIEKRIAGVRGDFEGKVKAKDKEIVDLRGQADHWSTRYRKTVLERAIRDAAEKAGVKSSAQIDVVLRSQGMWDLDDKGRPVAKDPTDPQHVLYGKDGTNPLSPLEWVESLKTEAPHFFGDSSGSGAPGNGTGGVVKATKVRYKSDLKTAAEKSAFISEYGYDVFAKLPLSPPA